MVVAQRGDGVRLGPLVVDDAAALAANLDRAREHIRPWVGAAFVTEGEAAARATIERYTDTAAHGERLLLGLWDDDRLVGGVMFVSIDPVTGVAEAGCWLEPDAEGRGLVTWACERLLDWGFGVRGLQRVAWQCRADNVRSAAVARRLGMTLEGVLRRTWLVDGRHHDTQVWAVLAEEWAARRPA